MRDDNQTGELSRKIELEDVLQAYEVPVTVLDGVTQDAQSREER